MKFMKWIFALSLACLCFSAMATTFNPTTSMINSSRQMVLVITKDWNSTTGTAQRFQRSNDRAAWKVVGKPFQVSLGKNGLAWNPQLKGTDFQGPQKTEGDMRTPAGVFELGPAFGFAKNNQKTKLFYLRIKPTTICVNDAKSKFYGRIIDTAKIPQKDWAKQEQMHQDTKYQQGIVVDYNMDSPNPGIGSCVFFHAWQQDTQATNGNIATNKDEINSLVSWLDSNESPVLVQLPEAQYQKFKAQWKLPSTN